MRIAFKGCEGRRLFVLVPLLASMSLLLGCSEKDPSQLSLEPAPTDRVNLSPIFDATSNGGLRLPSNQRASSTPPIVSLGSGQFVRPDVSSTATASPASSGSGGPDVTLNFVNVDVRDVVRGVLGDILRVAYVIDPGVQGQITLETGRPITREALIPTLETSLQLSGIALVFRDGVYRVLPIANAAREARLGGPSGSGFVTKVITPRFVAATDLQRVMEPLLPPGSSVRADPGRNVLILTGTEQSVANATDNIATFDVDYLRGMSFAILPLKNGQAKDVVRDLTSMLGTSPTLAGIIRVVPIDRLNAVLVTSMQPAYIERVRGWVDRLDRGGNTQDRRLFVYRVQNGRASDLAAVLRKAVGLDSGGSQTSGSGAAPSGQGFSQDPLGSRNSAPGLSGAGAPASLSNVPSILSGPIPASNSLPSASESTGAGSNGPEVSIRVVADETNNALVISATPQEYAVVEAALLRLDITPLQVLVEATVAEVTLSDQLTYGLQYYIKSGNFQAVFGNNATRAVNTTFSGFNFLPGYDFAFSTAAGSSVVLQLLQQLTTVRVLSSPNLLVLNNQTGRLQVGDQVPIATQSAVSTITSNAPVVNSIEYRDTGVILRITPRVNAGGLVLLDISQEISDVSTTTSSQLNSPTIQQRRLSSSVAVLDGQTIALGGLIRDSRNTSRSGIPFLQDLPLVGPLFGTRNNGTTRTELIVLITPRVVRNSDESRAISDELRQKLPLTIPIVTRRGR